MWKYAAVRSAGYEEYSLASGFQNWSYLKVWEPLTMYLASQSFQMTERGTSVCTVLLTSTELHTSNEGGCSNTSSY